MSILDKDFRVYNNYNIGFEFEFFSNYSYEKTIELLNLELYPIKVYPQSRYHSGFETSKTKFKIEPDFSGGHKMVELITHWFPYYEARIILSKILLFIQKHGSTNEHSALQYTISKDDFLAYNLTKEKVLKFILNFDENYIYDRFPERRNNIYAQSILKIIPDKDYIFDYNVLDNMVHAMKLPTDKYHGVNFSKEDKWEFRYIGGKDYQNKIVSVHEIIDYSIYEMERSFSGTWKDSEVDKLRRIMTANTIKYKNFSDYDYITSNFPQVKIKVDKEDEYNIVKSFYSVFWQKIYNILKNFELIPEMILNYDSNYKQMELVNAEIDVVFNITDINIINCTIRNGVLTRCHLLKSDIENSHINLTKIHDSCIRNSKLIRCSTDFESEIYDSFFSRGVLKCQIEGSIVRNSKIFDKEETKKSNDLGRRKKYHRFKKRYYRD